MVISYVDWAIRSQVLKIVIVRSMDAVQRLNVSGLEKF